VFYWFNGRAAVHDPELVGIVWAAGAVACHICGYFNYHAVPTNSRALVAVRTEIVKSGHRVAAATLSA
jgi:hypothetical protein